MPHGARLRKRRGRLLKPVKPFHKVELWYKQQLLAVVAQLRKIVREELLPELRMLEPLYSSASDGMARDRMGLAGPHIEARIGALKRRFRGIDGVAQRLAQNGAMTQIRQMSLGIERYVWQTSGDERVRDVHADVSPSRCSTWTILTIPGALRRAPFPG